MISYEDLDLRIQVSRNGFVVSAQRGSQNTSERFEPVRVRSWDFETLERRGPDEVKRLGTALFNALIRGKVRRLYDQGRGGTVGDASKGLRIRILIDTSQPRLQPFTKVPWEILYDSTARPSHLLALDARRPIVRMIDSSEPLVRPAAGDLQRVLLASANPLDAERLDVDKECGLVRDSLRRNHLTPEVLTRTSRTALFEGIRDGKPQIVHFMGHGSFDSFRQEGALLLERKRRARDLLRASELATFFNGNPAPRLVVLNACETAVAGRTRTFNAFSSAAAALVAGGLPAVIAMQSTIGDANAIKFTERLYRRLMEGDPVEAAIADGRVALKGADAYTLNWAVPVLYVRADGGGAMVRKDSDRQQPPQPVQSSEPASRPEIVGIVINGPVAGPVTQNMDVKK